MVLLCNKRQSKTNYKITPTSKQLHTIKIYNIQRTRPRRNFTVFEHNNKKINSIRKPRYTRTLSAPAVQIIFQFWKHIFHTDTYFFHRRQPRTGIRDETP